METKTNAEHSEIGAKDAEIQRLKTELAVRHSKFDTMERAYRAKSSDVSSLMRLVDHLQEALDASYRSYRDTLRVILQDYQTGDPRVLKERMALASRLLEDAADPRTLTIRSLAKRFASQES